MRIAKVVLGSKREEHAVFLENGERLECVTAVSVEASVEGGGVATATITVQLRKGPDTTPVPNGVDYPPRTR